MTQWIMFIITVLSCAYALYCQFRVKAFERGFILLAKLTYNPKTKEECEEIVRKIHELDRLEETDNK